MNMFAVSLDPTESARSLCDQHITKMPTETLQCLVASLLRHGAPPNDMPLTKSKNQPHKGGYPNHPVTRWVGESRSNFLWALYHGAALCEEYERRYDKTHFCAVGIEQCFLMTQYIPEGEMTPFVRAFNQSVGKNLDLLDWDCPHEAYREFYRRDKASFARWNKFRNPPKWWTESPSLNTLKGAE